MSTVTIRVPLASDEDERLQAALTQTEPTDWPIEKGRETHPGKWWVLEMVYDWECPWVRVRLAPALS